MIGGLIVLLVFQLAGEVAAQWAKIPIPGPVLGLMLLFTVLVIRGGVPENLRVTSDTLIQHLMLLLVPATTGMMIFFPRIGKAWLPIMLAGVGGTAVTMAVTALTLRLLVARTRVRVR